MTSFNLPQRQIVESSLDLKLFVSGPAGTGKTSAGVERMRYLLAQGVPGESILMLTPQRTLQEPYLDLLYSPERAAGGEVTSATMGGLACRMVDLFWPIAAEGGRFRNPKSTSRLSLPRDRAILHGAHCPPVIGRGIF